MTTTEAFLEALNHPTVKSKYPNPSIRNWRSRAKREMISIDFMTKFLLENGYVLLQEMRWLGDEKPANSTNGWNEGPSHTVHHNGHVNGTVADEKIQLRKKLFALRRQMDPELINNWFEACTEIYSQDFPERKLGLTDSAFYQMTSGRHFSKGNTIFAIKVLKEGKRLLEQYNELIRSEIENV